MYIYKITNTINNKSYIGQTTKTIQERFHRHITDALNNVLNTHLACAIRKYGADAFIVEQIDTANNQEELNNKEHYYIHYYDTLKNGYNETDSIYKSGGNTYAGRSKEKMDITRAKLSLSKLGGKNPAARKVKCKNIHTNEELHFNSYAEMRDYFNETQHNFITRRCRHQTKCLYKKEWAIAYEEEEYDNFTEHKQIKNSKSVKSINLETKEEKIFPSYAAVERELKLSRDKISREFKKSPNGFIIEHFQIIPIN